MIYTGLTGLARLDTILGLTSESNSDLAQQTTSGLVDRSPLTFAHIVALHVCNSGAFKRLSDPRTGCRALKVTRDGEVCCLLRLCD